MFSPPPSYDALPMPAGAVVVEVPLRDLDRLCVGLPPHPARQPLYGCAILDSLTAYVPTWATWPGTRACWLEIRRHETAHLKGWIHP